MSTYHLPPLLPLPPLPPPTHPKTRPSILYTTPTTFLHSSAHNPTATPPPPAPNGRPRYFVPVPALDVDPSFPIDYMEVAEDVARAAVVAAAAAEGEGEWLRCVEEGMREPAAAVVECLDGAEGAFVGLSFEAAADDDAAEEMEGVQMERKQKQKQQRTSSAPTKPSRAVTVPRAVAVASLDADEKNYLVQWASEGEAPSWHGKWGARVDPALLAEWRWSKKRFWRGTTRPRRLPWVRVDVLGDEDEGVNEGDEGEEWMPDPREREWRVVSRK